MERDFAALRIGELANRTGVGIATLRAWESRYRLLRPSRTAGGQRLYSVEDESRVREVLRLVADGRAVGAAARWVADREGESAPSPESDVAPPGGIGGGSGRAVATKPDTARRITGAGEAELLATIHDTTRAIVHAATPADVVNVLAGFVRQTGASLVEAVIDDAVLPVDLSFGEGRPLLPRAEAMSVARMTLEQALPALVEDARRVIDLLRRTEASRPVRVEGTT